jgi:hypothetical protein
MPRHLHLLRSDSSGLAGPAIEADARRPGAEVTVVLLDDAPPPHLPGAARVLALGAGGLDYAALLDLIFESDHVVSW